MREMRSGASGRQEPGLRRLLQTIGQYPLLTDSEESALLRRIQDGAREPLELLVDANLRRVVGIAGEFLGRGLGYVDLIAEGTLGLISAARRLDDCRVRDFTRYSEGRIRRQILAALGDLPGRRESGTFCATDP